MRSARLAALLAFALGWARPDHAVAAGADPFDFLFLDADARPVAMGGAYTALAEDPNSLLYNPAGLAGVRRHAATFMHNQHFEGITQEYAAFASPRGWGANLNYLSFGDVKETTIVDPDGAGLGRASLTDLSLGAGYGRALMPGFWAGAGVKLIRESIAGVSAQGIGFDVGLRQSWAALPGLTCGLAVQNMGPSVRFQGAKENLPLTVRLGSAYRFMTAGQASALSFDVTKERSDQTLIAFGAEIILAKALPLRFGFNTRNNVGPGVTAGVGWLYRDFGFDYAFVPYGELGSSHRMSATVRW